MTRFSTLFLFALASSSAFARGNKNGGNKNGNNGGNKNNNGGNGNLSLDPALINQNAKQNGFNASNALQANSLTSNNNFINFCKGKTLTNGEQVKSGSCNGIVMGDIPNTDNMPAAKFLSPKNLDTIVANEDFTIKCRIKGMQTGNFVNAKTNYYGAPQQLNGAGQIIGHTHFVIAPIRALDSTDVGDALKFSFFKGIDTKADPNGVSSVNVPGGLPTGTYRMCTINTSANHVPVLGPVAQHDSYDDCVYFIAKSRGKLASEKKAKGNNGGKKNRRHQRGKRMNVMVIDTVES